jgi:predicted enzyme involved in methoxymalonyl-ACP biosynthesis
MPDFRPDPNAVQRMVDLAVMSTRHPAEAGIACIIAACRIFERDLEPELIATVIEEAVAEALQVTRLVNPQGNA